uniref:Uncharacterized protein n=1 Tax=Rhizophora mucronata TaxID=61149 RepID=A0A2P2IUH8_RHIMU
MLVPPPSCSKLEKQILGFKSERRLNVPTSADLIELSRREEKRTQRDREIAAVIFLSRRQIFLSLSE